MTISNARATFGLNAKATPTKSGTSGTVQIGDSNESISLTGATKIVSFDAVIVGSTSDLIIDVSTLNNTGSTSWTSGAAQIETATAAGSVSAGGNASVVVTSAGMTGSPITLAVAVATSDTPTLWAAKVRTALNANAVIAARFTVGGSTTAISLTRKPTSTYTVNGTAVNVYPADDATLNIALATGTATGITTAATSANTTAGVATAGAYCPDLDGNDFEGEATGGLSDIGGVFIKNNSNSVADAYLTQGTEIVLYPVKARSSIQCADPNNALSTYDIKLEPSNTGDNSCFVTVTLVGA